jgi:cell division protein FtsL
MNRLNKLLIILIIVFLVVLGIRFIQYKNIKYLETNRETVIEEEIENKVEDIPSEKKPIQSPKQEEYEGDKQYGDSIMIF